MAELMLGQPLFPGESGIDQLVEIIKVLGTPTREQIRTMNPNYMEHKFPQIKPHPFNKVRLLSLTMFTTGESDQPRFSARLPRKPLTSSRRSWNTLLSSDCQRSRPYATHSSTSFGIRTPGYRTRVITTILPRNCRIFLTSRGMVSRYTGSSCDLDADWRPRTLDCASTERPAGSPARPSSAGSPRP